MPTGYTYKLMQEGQSFNDFVLTCARAMGACVLMRDDPLDAPIPEFKPSEFNSKAHAEAELQLESLRRMSNKDKIRYGQVKKEENVGRTKGWLDETREQNGRLLEMKSAVEKWEPPTESHAGLKKFMLEQIDISFGSSDGYIEKQLAAYEAKSPMEYYAEAVREAEHSLQYHAEEDQKERDRTDNRNQWIRELRASLESKGNRELSGPGPE